jgi:asparagine synthase (glutamine-hydrolysing)
MCGICGILFFDENRCIQSEALSRMCNTLRHRGPDDEGYLIDGRLGLGVRRLAVIDLLSGHQPIHNENSTVHVVLNGEIYNFRELRHSLQEKGHKFYTASDTEVIVHLYEDHGEDFVTRMNGMFALALWDKERARLLLARDRLGVKPLFYQESAQKLIFGSELKSILCHGDVDRSVDMDALSDYISYQYIPYPLTIYRDIKKLSPGHMLIADSSGLRLKRYWDIDYSRKAALTEEESKEKLIELLKDSVKLRMTSDVPLGAFLSGGIDSSAVVAFMSGCSNSPVRTYSMGFKEGTFNELKYARRISSMFGTVHREYVVEPPNIVSLLPGLMEYFDEPFGDPSAIPVYMISKMARDEITVCLSGDGGDELFAGYERYTIDRLMRAYNHVPPVLRSGIANKMFLALPESTRARSIGRKLHRFMHAVNLKPEYRYISLVKVFNDSQKQVLCDTPLWKETNIKSSTEKFAAYLGMENASEDVDKLLFMDTRTYLPGDLLTKVDMMSMANSLEVRNPFLDYRLVEFAASIPPELKLHGLRTKYILKKALRGIVPDEILRRRKYGFGVPIGSWFRKELRDFVNRNVLEGETTEKGFFNRQYVIQILEDHFSGRQDFSHHIWVLLIFELWYRRWA